jgi:hypothetical protein
MVAHYHAQTWNGAEIARAFGVGESSGRRYLDLLTDALVLRQLPPWHANVSKRQVRSPKVFVEDSGLLHALLGIESENDLAGHPKVGASWEGFLIKEIVERLNARTEECFFWATHSGAELDLLIVSGQRLSRVRGQEDHGPQANSLHGCGTRGSKLGEARRNLRWRADLPSRQDRARRCGKGVARSDRAASEAVMRDATACRLRVNPFTGKAWQNL